LGCCVLKPKRGRRKSLRRGEWFSPPDDGSQSIAHPKMEDSEDARQEDHGPASHYVQGNPIGQIDEGGHAQERDFENVSISGADRFAAQKAQRDRRRCSRAG